MLKKFLNRKKKTASSTEARPETKSGDAALKKLIIAYTMHGPDGETEGTFELAMLPGTADALLAGGSDGTLDAILAGIARLRGYDSAVFTGAVATC